MAWLWISASVEFGWGDDNYAGTNFKIGCPGNSYGFYEGKVYSCSFDYCSPQENSFYIDTPLVSIASIFPERDSLNVDLDLFIMQPSGLGVYTRLDQYFRARNYFFPPEISYYGWGMSFGMGMMFKVENDWPGSPAFGSIAPNQGEQESTLSLTVTCVNTTFRDDPPVEIAFIPSDGLTVTNISVISNAEIEFNLKIAADSPLGQKSVIVTYGFPAASITGNNVFEVLERTNSSNGLRYRGDSGSAS